MSSERQLGARLRDVRQRAGLTQGELAVALGVHRSTISASEHRASGLAAARIAQAAEVLGVSARELLGPSAASGQPASPPKRPLRASGGPGGAGAEVFRWGWDAEQATDSFQRLMFSYQAVDRLAAAEPGTTRQWIRGHRSRSVSWPGSSYSRGAGASFFDLIEVLAVARLRELGWELEAIRAVLDACGGILEEERVCVRESLWRHGGGMFSVDGVLARDGGIAQEEAESAWSDALQPLLRTFDYGHGFVWSWWPLGKQRAVVLDPDAGHGFRMHVVPSWRSTEAIYEWHRDGRPPGPLAELNAAEIRDGLKFELATPRCSLAGPVRTRMVITAHDDQERQEEWHHDRAQPEPAHGCRRA